MLNNLKYIARLARSVASADEPRSRPSIAKPLVAAIVLGSGFASTSFAPHETRRADQVDALQARAERLQAAMHSVEDVWTAEIAPIDRVLRSYRDDPALTSKIALALVREARNTGVEPRLLMAVLLVENPWLDPDAVSPVGALGLMQVMPFHRGEWQGCGDRLDDVDSNICHGARIFADYLRSSKGNIDRALLRYNGCVNGTNTPNCHLYPQHVYARAGRASLLAWRSGLGFPATP